MNATEKIVVGHALSQIEPALTPGSMPHAHFLVVRSILDDAHGAANHGTKKRGRRKKAEAAAGGETPA